MNFRMIQAMIESIRQSTEKKIEGDSNNPFRYYLYSILNKYT